MPDLQICSIKVGGVQYNVVRASAINQKKLLMIVGARLALNSNTSGIEEINVPMVKGLLLTLSEQDIDSVAEIVLHHVKKNGSTEKEPPVTIETFQNEMNAYFTLIAEAIKANLQDFFTWLDTENAESRQKTSG